MKRERFTITDIAEAIVETAPQNAPKPFPYIQSEIYTFEDCVRGLRASLVTLADRARERAGPYWTQEYRRKAGNPPEQLDREHMGGIFDQAVYEIEHNIKMARTFKDRGITVEDLSRAEQHLLEPRAIIISSANQNTQVSIAETPHIDSVHSIVPPEDSSSMLFLLP